MDDRTLLDSIVKLQKEMAWVVEHLSPESLDEMVDRLRDLERDLNRIRAQVEERQPTRRTGHA